MKRNKGFTLIELMIVVAILGILASVAVPQYLDYISVSKRSAVLDNFDNARRTVMNEFSRISAGNIPRTQARLVEELNGIPGTSIVNHNPYLLTSPAFAQGVPTLDGETGVAVSYSGAGGKPLTGDTVTVTSWFVGSESEGGKSALRDGPDPTNSRTVVLTFE